MTCISRIIQSKMTAIYPERTVVWCILIAAKQNKYRGRLLLCQVHYKVHLSLEEYLWLGFWLAGDAAASQSGFCSSIHGYDFGISETNYPFLLRRIVSFYNYCVNCHRRSLIDLLMKNDGHSRWLKAKSDHRFASHCAVKPNVSQALLR